MHRHGCVWGVDNAIEVAAGISTSDRVVNNPSAALLEGDKVRVVTPARGYDLVNVSAQPQTPQRPQSSEPAQLPPHTQP